MLCEKELVSRIKEWLATVSLDTPIVMLAYGSVKGRETLRDTNVNYLIKYLAKKMSLGYTKGEILPTKIKGRNFEIILPVWEWKLKNKKFSIVLHNVDEKKQSLVIKVCY